MNPVSQGPVVLRPSRQPGPCESLVVTIGTDLARAEGVLDELTVDLLLAAADFLFTRGSSTVTLDLTGTDTIDSDAVRELFHAQLNTAAGHSLRFIVPPHLRPRLAVCCPEDRSSSNRTGSTELDQ